jgi:hypothetical protein
MLRITFSTIAILAYGAIYFLLASLMEAEYVKQSYPTLYVGFSLGIYFLIHDRKLVERRMNIGPVAEQRPAQKMISALFMAGFVGFVVIPASTIASVGRRLRPSCPLSQTESLYCVSFCSSW